MNIGFIGIGRMGTVPTPYPFLKCAMVILPELHQKGDRRGAHQSFLEQANNVFFVDPSFYPRIVVVESYRHHAPVSIQMPPCDADDLESLVGSQRRQMLMGIQGGASNGRRTDHHDGGLTRLQHSEHLPQYEIHIPEVSLDDLTLMPVGGPDRADC